MSSSVIHFQELLQKCFVNKDISFARHAHSLVICNEFDLSTVIAHQLIRIFGSLGRLFEANLAFQRIDSPNVHHWHAIVSGHALCGQSCRALELYQHMQQDGIQPNKFIFPSVLKICGIVGASEYAKDLHSTVTQYGCESDVVIGTTLVDMYIKLDHLDEARKVFDFMEDRNVVSWAAMIDGYTEHSQGIRALQLYERMCTTSVKPDKVIFLCIVKACSGIEAEAEGMLMHDRIVKAELESDIVLGNTLVDMYAKCGKLDAAHKIFEMLPNHSIVSWGAIISGYAQNDHGVLALELYERMVMEGLQPNKIILPCVLKACGNTGNLQQGRQVHEQMEKYWLHDVVIGSTLVDMYVKCGSLEEAHQVFDELPTRNVVSWCAIICGYMEQGQGCLSLDLFKKMLRERIEPDSIIFIAILKACGSIGAVEQGMIVHSHILESNSNMDVITMGALADMYAKCGSISDAQKLLKETVNQNAVLWGSIIAGCAQDGNWSLALQCIEDMQRVGININDTIYTNILSACSHAGKLEEGCEYFKSMTNLLSAIPNIDHFTCMIDLLSGSGQLKDAAHLIQTMPLVPDIMGWTSLLTACKTYGSVDLAKTCFNQVSKLDPTGPGFALMSTIYSQAYMWEEFYKVQESQFSSCSWKKPGIAWIEANHTVEEFKVGDITHGESNSIYANLRRLNRVMKDEGYIPKPENCWP